MRRQKPTRKKKDVGKIGTDTIKQAKKFVRIQYLQTARSRRSATHTLMMDCRGTPSRFGKIWKIGTDTI